MKDIVKIENGKDLFIGDSAAPKAANVVGTQIGSLTYAPEFGSDLKYFLKSQLQFQNASFQAYLIERLTLHQVNVAEVTDVVETFQETFGFKVGDSELPTEGLIR